MTEKLLLAMDGSPFSIACFDDLVKLGDKKGLMFDVIFVENGQVFSKDMPYVKPVSILDGDDIIFDEMNIRLQKESIKRALDFQSRHKSRDIRLIVREGKVEEELIRAAKGYQALIVGAVGWKVADTHFRTAKIGTRFLFPNLSRTKISGMAARIAEKNPGATLIMKRSLMDIDFAAVKGNIKVPDKIKQFYDFLTETGKIPLKEANAASVVVIDRKEIGNYQTVNASLLIV